MTERRRNRRPTIPCPQSERAVFVVQPKHYRREHQRRRKCSAHDTCKKEYVTPLAQTEWDSI